MIGLVPTVLALLFGEGQPTWVEPIGLTREGTAAAFVGLAYRDGRRLAAGTTFTYGIRRSFELVPIEPGRAGLRRAFRNGWLGTQIGGDIVFTTLLGDRVLRAGPGIALVARNVIVDRQSSRVRAPAVLGFLLPSPGVLFDANATAALHLRWSAPFSILVTDRIGVELDTASGLVALGGRPPFSYFTFGVGIVVRSRGATRREDRSIAP